MGRKEYGRYGKHSRRDRRKKKGGIISTVILIVAICVFAFSAFQLYKIFNGYHKGESEYDDLVKLAQGTSIIPESMYVAPTQLNFGANPRATYVSIMRVGAQLDDELVVKRVM